MINSNEEILLDLLLSKYKKDKYDIIINCNELPDYMKFSIKDSFERLKIEGLISKYSVYISGECWVIITPDALQYYNRKGSKKELFSLLSDDEKDMLKEIIKLGNTSDITEFLRKKVDNDVDDINRGVIGNLKSNGLLKVQWADDTIRNACLTQNGKTFFEREKKYNEEKKSSFTYINAQNGNVFMGNITNSQICINNITDSLEKKINDKCETDEEKEELIELLDEAKEIIDNYNQSSVIPKRKGFFKRLSSHMDKHGWFYAEIVSLFGQFVLSKLNGQ